MVSPPFPSLLSQQTPAVEFSTVVGLITALGVVMAGLVFVLLGYRRSAFKWKARSQHWFEVAMGSTPMVSEDGAKKLMRDLFPKPMGAPSTSDDVISLREWRERRALVSRDHTTRHSVDAKCDSEAATEILMFTVGGYETDR